MIARMWRGWVRTADRSAYVDYIESTGMAAEAFEGTITDLYLPKRHR